MATEILKTAKETKVSPQSSPSENGANTSNISGSIAVLEALIAEGVDTIFGYDERERIEPRRHKGTKDH